MLRYRGLGHQHLNFVVMLFSLQQKMEESRRWHPGCGLGGEALGLCAEPPYSVYWVKCNAKIDLGLEISHMF